MHYCLMLLLSAVLMARCIPDSERNHFRGEKEMILNLLVSECPKVVTVHVPKEKLLGVWVAYATTPLPYHNFKRRCITHNVANVSPFENGILFYDDVGVLITYKCSFSGKYRNYARKLHIMTRTHTPPTKAIWAITQFLMYIKFPLSSLYWLGGHGFCFELYMLKFETHPRPMQFQAPFNLLEEFGR